MAPSTTVDQDVLNRLLSKMSLPINRTSVRRDEDCRWLLQNLSVRNKQHPDFDSAYGMLLNLARERKLFKTSELRQFELLGERK